MKKYRLHYLNSGYLPGYVTKTAEFSLEEGRDLDIEIRRLSKYKELPDLPNQDVIMWGYVIAIDLDDDVCQVIG